MSIQNFLADNDKLLVRDEDTQERSPPEKHKRPFFFAKDRKKRSSARDTDRSELLYVSSKGYFFQ